MNKFFCAMMFALAFGVVAFTVQPVKADTLDERVGALAVDTALSSFVDVLPSPEQVESLGGVQSWLGKVGQQFKEAWERDNRNWQNFVDSIDGLVDDSFGSVFEVAENVVKDVRDVVYNFYNLIFGIEEEIGGYVTDNASIASAIASFNSMSSDGRNYCILIGNGVSSGYYQKVYLSYIRNADINNRIIYAPWNTQYGYFLNDVSTASAYVYAYNVPLTVLYWGSRPELYYNRVVDSFPNVTVNFIDMLASTDDVSFVPTVNNNYFNKYYFGFGDGSTVSPSRIVNNYETVYNYVSNNSYTDAVKEIKDSPKGFWQKIKDVLGNVHISIGGFGGVDIDFPDTDNFNSLYGDTDTSSVLTVEHTSWLSFFSMLPTELITMLVMAVAVGCVCIIIKAVR